jgi:stage II sporulation protein D
VFLSGPADGLSVAAQAPAAFAAGADFPRVQHGRTPYRGRLEILAAGSAQLYSLVNVVNMEDYLLGVVPSEMPASWPLEALKAQAVAARTYAVSNLRKHASRGFDLCDDIHCQAYLGYSNEYPGPTVAVRATSGLVATYGGRLINAVYHAHAGGATDSSAVIWGAAEPYLVGTSETYEKPYYWTATNRRTEVEAAILSAKEGKVPDGLFPLLSAKPASFTPGGRARTVLLKGPAGESSIGAVTLRGKLGSYRLRSDAIGLWQVGSTWLWPDWTSAAGMASALQTITWAPGDRGTSVLVFGTLAETGTSAPLGVISPEFFVFSGQGFGHGVGMSQWGAREMAAGGKNYRQILAQFYKGIAIAPNYGR